MFAEYCVAFHNATYSNYYMDNKYNYYYTLAFGIGGTKITNNNNKHDI